MVIKLLKRFLYELEKVIEQRITDNTEGSYTAQLFSKGINKVAQKVGEEAVELVIESRMIILNCLKMKQLI